MTDEILFDGVRHLSAAEAAASSGFTRDYISRLCRDGKVRGRRVGKSWYVDKNSLETFLLTQEHERAKRTESLSRERVREYHGDEIPPAKQTTVIAPSQARIVVPEAPRPISTKPIGMTLPVAPASVDVRGMLERALRGKARAALDGAAEISRSPSGLTHAALQAAHIPPYALSPVAEFAHKVVALTLAIALVFGTYAVVDPQYAQYAIESIHEQVATAVDAYRNATGGGIEVLADRAQSQLAAVAEDPQLAASGLMEFAALNIPDAAAQLARAVNAGVNAFAYTLANSFAQLRSRILIAQPSGEVSVQIRPYVSGPETATSTPTPTGAVFAQSGAPTSQIIERTVIEQAPSAALAIAGGITEDELNAKLNELDNKLTSQIFSLTAANSTTIAQNYNVTAQTNAIDQLSNTSINSPTISGGSISGASVGATSLSASGNTLLSDTTVNGDLDVLGAVDLQNISLASSTLNITASPTQSSNLIQVSDASGTVLFAVQPNGTILTTNSSSTEVYTSLLVAGGATTTTLHTTTLDAISASTTYLWVSVGATTTSLFATSTTFVDSTSTTLFSTLGHIATGVIDNLSSTIAAIGGLTVTNATTTNATTTNEYVSNLSAASASTTDITFATALGGNATTSALFSSVASSTNLFAQTASLGSLDLVSTLNVNGLSTFNGFISTASSTIGNGTQSGGLTVSGGATTTGSAYIAGAAGIGGAPNSSSILEVAGTPTSQTKGVFNIDVNNAAQNTIYGAGITVNDVNDQSSILFAGQVGSTPIFKYTYDGSGGSAIHYQSSKNQTWDNGSGGTLMELLVNSGNLGLGNTSPSYKLDVGGAGHFTQFVDASYFVATSSSATSLFNGNLTVNGKVLLASATTTNFFATTASSTNLSAQAASLGSLTFPGITSALLTTNASGEVVATSTIGINLLSADTIGLSDSNNTLTIGSSPASLGGTLSATLNLAHANSWTGLQQFANSTSSEFSATQKAWFGTSGQSSFDFNGALSLGTPLAQTSGGTGIGSYSTGDILYADNSGNLQRLPIGASGNVLTVQAGLPAWGVGSGGGSGGTGAVGVWATTTDSLATYPTPTSYVVIVGANSTSSANSIFEVHGNSYTSGNVGIGTTSPATALSVAGSGYLTGGLGVGVLNTTAGSLQTSGNVTVGGLLLLPAVGINSLLYNNGFNQAAAASTDPSLTFSGGVLALNTGNSNAFSALQQFNGGITSYASSTIGNGTQGGGLIINGGATTTGNAYTAGEVYAQNGLRVRSITGDDTNGAPWYGIGETNSGTVQLAGYYGLDFATNFGQATLSQLGNFGISQTSPSYKLDVGGAGHFTQFVDAAYLVATSSSATSLFNGNVQVNGATTLTSLTASNATTTTLFSATASSTNLFAQTASLGALALPNISGALLATNAAGQVISTSTISTSLLSADTISGVALGGTLANLSALNGTLTFSGAYNGSSAQTVALNLGNQNNWTGLQTFGNASSTNFSVFTKAYFGGTATSTFDSAGDLAVAGTLNVTGATTLTSATTTNLFSTTASSTNLFAQTASLGALSLVSALPIASGGTNATSFTTGAPLAFDGTRFVSTSTLAVAYGGTGANTFTADGVLFGNGAGAIQATAAAANSILVTNGSSVPSFSTMLPAFTLGGAVSGNAQSISNVASLGIATGTSQALLAVKGLDQSAATKAIEITDSNNADLLKLFDNGLLVLQNLIATASSTIGNGTQAGGLTIAGGATTTGNSLIQGNATTSGAQSVGGVLSVTGNTSLTGSLAVNSAATSTFANGISLTSGCITVGGTCIGGSSSGNTGVTLTQVIASTSPGSNTSFTVPSNTAYIVVDEWGAGGAGGAGDGATAGQSGGVSCFSNSSTSTACSGTAGPILQANGGSGGTARADSIGTAGGAGGTATGGTINITGGGGSGGGFSNSGSTDGSGGAGGTAASGGGGGLGGAGTSGAGGAGSAPGGGGGGGGATTTGHSGGGGGGAGGFAQKTITAPSGSYYYTIGAGGSTGGGSGGSGGIVIYVYTASTLTNSTTGVTLTRTLTATSGTNVTYTPPSNISYIVVKTWGAGGGGGGGNAGTTSGGNGGSTCFSNSSTSTACSGATGPIVYATGGTGGLGNVQNSGGSSTAGAGGTGLNGDINISGSAGGGGAGGNTYIAPSGGSAPGGGGGGNGNEQGPGQPGAAYGGGGGAGSGVSGTGGSGMGGGGGGFAEKTIMAPSGSYYYTIGTGGTAGSGTYAGGAGGAGGIEIDEYTTSALQAVGTQGQIAYFTGTNTSAGTSTLYISNASQVGIGTTTPWASLSIVPSIGQTAPLLAIATSTSATTSPAFQVTAAGNTVLATSTYLNWGATEGTSGYGLRDNAGTLQFKNSGGAWTGIGTGGGGSGATLAGSYATSTVGTTTVQLTGAAGSSASFSGGVLTLPSNTVSFVVEVWGGGGGGSGSASSGNVGSVGNGGSGGTICFSASAIACSSPLAAATGGGGGVYSTNVGGAGGSGTTGDVILSGSAGVSAISAGAAGANGGSAPRGGGGANATTFNAAGVAGAPFGGGGSGAGESTGGTYTGSAGGGGGYAEKLISSPSGTYTFNVPAGGTAGTAGTSGFAGGTGGTGGIVITYYTGAAVTSGFVASSSIAGAVPFYATASSSLTATTSIFISPTTGNVGIGGTTTPNSLLSVGGSTGGGINFTTATSTFYTTGGLVLTNGCLQLNGVCFTGNNPASVTLTQVIASSSPGANTAITFPTNTAYVVVETWGAGGGGGGGGSGAQGGSGGTGGTSCFGTNSTSTTCGGVNVVNATGGAGGGGGEYASIYGQGGGGGAGTGGDVNLVGGSGATANAGGDATAGGSGGSAPNGGGGAAATGGSPGSNPAGQAGAIYGGGGSGGAASGGGGGGGGFAQKTITTPSGTYYYTIGAGGNGGTQSGGVGNGGAGGAGGIIIYVYTTSQLTSSGAGVTLTRTITATSGTNISYTPPSNISYIVVKTWGAGGGGAGGGVGGGSGGTSGGTSCFSNSSTSTACSGTTGPIISATGGGTGGAAASGSGGSGSGGAVNLQGQSGQTGVGNYSYSSGGSGGNAPLGGGGGAGGSYGNGTAGAVFGGGGGGGGCPGSSNCNGGGGGGGGGYAEQTITAPSGTYYYTIGAGGTGGGNGASGGAGGIEIDEYTTSALQAVGTQGQVAYFTGTNTSAGTSTIYISSANQVGIGTTTPWANLSVTSPGQQSGSLSLFSVASTTGASIFNVLGNGDVLIGTTTPPASSGKSMLAWNASVEHGLVFQTSSATYNNGPILFLSTTGGIAGSIGQSETTVTYNTTSDRRLKENIATTTTGLATLLQIPVDNFDFIADPTHTLQQGFIAQTLYTLYPEAVTTNGDDGTTPLTATSTPWQVDYGRLTPLIVASVQDLNAKVDANASSTALTMGTIASSASSTLVMVQNLSAAFSAAGASTSTPSILSAFQGTSTPAVTIDALGNFSVGTSTATSTTAQQFCLNGECTTELPFYTSATSTATSSPSIAVDFAKAIEGVIADWLASAGNGIQDLYASVIHANEVDTQKLCVSDSSGSSTCVTRSQLDSLLAGAGASAGGGSSGASADIVASTSAPVIAINGNSPATIQVGATYSDLGAGIEGPAQDMNLGIKASVDGATTTAMSDISIDTSVPGMHTIEYIVTDQNGLQGTATRVVNVVGSITSDSTATSTDSTDQSQATSTPDVSQEGSAASSTSPTTDSGTSTDASSTTATSTTP